MTTLTFPSPEGGLRRYLAEIRRFPLLGKDEEYMLAKRWREHQDPEAARQLVTSHLRLSAKIALGYRGYGLPLGEMISEGNLGLMHAVKKFDPDKGFRLATYAVWWIRAAIQEFILKTWSIVKLGTGGAPKKLFFKLREAKARIAALSDGDLPPEQTRLIADRLGVREDEVLSMNRRLAARDASLNAPIAADSDEEWQDVLQDEAAADPERQLAEAEEWRLRSACLEAALATLTPRERHILGERRLKEPPSLLEDLGRQYGLSRERIRQIEARAFEKVQTHMLRALQTRLPEPAPQEPRVPAGQRVAPGAA
ncbi:MAG: RNA polymerase factor sigma-32 [Caulobacterales bacterium RIFCSPHIGHO2_01_FULL_70_19]|nr:MAG: RNA polymerase factor sigma-32 [Caulobacterales bacterium RIFCSPHIGHO2_01_FULL_70_19]